MDNKIQKLYKIGLVSSSSLDGYMNELQQTDKQIKKVLEEVGVDRLVSSYDRDYYWTWFFSWNLSDELILYALSVLVYCSFSSLRVLSISI